MANVRHPDLRRRGVTGSSIIAQDIFRLRTSPEAMNVLNAEERHAYAKAAFREAKKHDMGPTDTATIEGGAGLVMVVMKQNGEDVVYILTKAEATRSGLPKPSEMN